MTDFIVRAVVFVSNNVGGLWVTLFIVGALDSLLSIWTSKIKHKNALIEKRILPQVYEIKKKYKGDQDKIDDKLSDLYKENDYHGAFATLLFWFSFLLSFMVVISITRNGAVFKDLIDNISFLGIDDIISSGFTVLSLIYLLLSFLQKIIIESYTTEVQYTNYIAKLESKDEFVEKVELDDDGKVKVTWQEMYVDAYPVGKNDSVVLSDAQSKKNKKEIIAFTFQKMFGYVFIVMISFILSKAIIMISLARMTVRILSDSIKLVRLKVKNGKIKDRRKKLVTNWLICYN